MVEFGTWNVRELTAEEREFPGRSGYEYVVESGNGTGLIYCTERQLRELRDDIDATLEPPGDEDEDEDPDSDEPD